MKRLEFSPKSENPAQERVIQEWRDKAKSSGMRSWPEWIGKTGDTAIPDKVRGRVVLLWGAVCYISGKKLTAGEIEMEHVIGLADGGENREGNLRPVWNASHKGKTKKETKQRAKTARQRIKHVGARKPTKKIQNAGFQHKPKTVKLPLPKRTHDIYGRPI